MDTVIQLLFGPFGVAPVIVLIIALILLCHARPASAKRSDVHYDEDRVPNYTLPDPLRLEKGEVVTDAVAWYQERRPEILRLFETYVYGKTPTTSVTIKADVIEVDRKTLDGQGIRRQVRLTLSRGDQNLPIDLLIHLPHNSRPAPVFLGLNFQGNHSTHPDPAIKLPDGWMRPGPGVVDNQATEAGRGLTRSRWPVERIIAGGFGVATAYYGDIDPDFDDGFKNGAHGLFAAEINEDPARGRDAWGAISAWSWGLSRILDYLVTVPEIDGEKVTIVGHSRLGKAALWAGAQDERFAAVISNNSGCGGAAISRRRFGETVGVINESFPHWFCDNFRDFDGGEENLPVDQHMLISLIAPRPVYIASASEDLWADPKGELIAGIAADPVYRLLGTDGFGDQASTLNPLDSKSHRDVTLPPLNQPIGETIRYHLREGKHDITEYDWMQYLAFAARHLS